MSSVDDFFAELEALSTQSLNQRMDSYMSQTPQERAASDLSRSSSHAQVPGSHQRKGEERQRKRRRDAADPLPRAAPSTSEARESASTHWACSLCTLENVLSSLCCEACGQSREGASVWVCSACERVNPKGSPEDRKPRCAHCHTTQVPEGDGAARSGGNATAAMLLDDVEETVEGDPELEDEEREEDPVALASESDEEFEEDYEEEETSSDEDGPGQSLKANRRGRSGTDMLGVPPLPTDKELVAFLRDQPTVPFEKLPHAPPPASMSRGPPLRPFQLQGLYWMLHREGHPTAPMDVNTEGSSQDFLDDLLRDESTQSSGTPRVFGEQPCSGRVAPKKYHRGGILADYMGLGKTKMLISLCESAKAPKVDRLEFGRVGSAATIVVCPMSLMSQWLREITSSVFPPPRVLRYYGVNRRNKSIFEIAQKYDYVLTSFQTLSREPCDGAQPPSKLRMIHWHRAIVDEAHYIRNPRSVQSRAVTSTLDAKFRWAVTATPLQNRLGDLFPLLHFLRVPHFGDATWWNQEVAGPLAADPNSPRGVAALQLLFSSLMLRRLPTSTVDGVQILQLPPKEIRVVEVALNKDEREFYSALHQNATARVRAAARQTGRNALQAYVTAFEMLIRCRQCCLHPFIVVRALMEKATTRGLDEKSLLPKAAAPANGGASEADLNDFLAAMKRKLRAEESTFAQSALDGVADQEALRKLECVICFDVMRKPAILRCAHMFCEECIQNALPTTQRKCPLCKAPVKKGDITLVPEVVETATVSITDLVDRSLVEDHARWIISSKAQRILDIVHSVGDDAKIVIFSHFTTFLKYMAHVLEAHHITSATFTGDLSANRRDEVLQRFTKRAKPQVLLATITACGVGINLTRASHCIIADPSWNPGVEEQAMNRLHRIGQERPVTITRLLCPDTVDMDIDKLAESKRKLTRYCFGGSEGGGGFAGSGRLGKDDLLAMFTRPFDGAPTSSPMEDAAAS